MVTNELIVYMKTRIAAGAGRNEITTALKEGGWTEEQIAMAFHEITSLSQPPVSTEIESTNSNSVSLEDTINPVWAKIKKRNRRMLTSGWFLCVVSVMIILNGRIITGLDGLLNDVWLGLFVWLMFGVVLLFSIFVWFENKYLAKTYDHTLSKSDQMFSYVIRFRNFVFVLSLIPFIQVIGFVMLMYGGWLFLIVYIMLLLRRSKSIVQNI